MIDRIKEAIQSMDNTKDHVIGYRVTEDGHKIIFVPNWVLEDPWKCQIVIDALKGDQSK